MSAFDSPVSTVKLDGKALFESAPEAMVVVDNEQRIVLANRQSMKLFGGSVKESKQLIGSSLSSFLRRDAAVGARFSLKRASKGEDASDWCDGDIVRCSCPDAPGSYKLSVRSLNPGGDSGCWIISFSDISYNRALERSAYRMADLSNEILATANTLIIVVDQNARIVRFNHACERVSGLAFEEVVGRSVDEVIKGLDEEEKSDVFSLDSAVKGAEALAKSWVLNDGSVRQIDWRTSLLEDDEKGTRLVVACGTDVTEREISNRIMERDRRLLKQFVDRVPAAVAMFDRRFAYVSASHRWREALGVLDIPLGGRFFSDVHREGDAAAFWTEALSTCLEGQSVQSAEDSFQREDGTVKLLRWEMRPWFDENRKTGGVMIFADDITEQVESEKLRRELESQLHHSQKIEAIGTLAGGIAHDFNNILGSIMGFSELIDLSVAEGNPEARDYSAQIMAASKRAKKLVEQILTFSRRGKKRAVLTYIDSVIEEVANFVEAVKPANVVLELKLEKGCPAIYGDPDQLHQVVMNLCTNAVHAMEELPSGVLSIGAQSCYLGEEDVVIYRGLKPGHYLKITVQDTGSGMDEPTVDRIFDPFFTTKPQGRGTGLGLSVVHGIIREHQGQIFVYSRPGRGTRMTLYLPAHDGPAVPKAEVTNLNVESGGGQRVLLVDDEQGLCDAESQLLMNYGYEVDAYTNPAEALRVFQRQPNKYDVVITDMDMPEVSGVDLGNAIRACRATIPIILNSGFISRELRASGALDCISKIVMKPTTSAELTRAVAEVLALKK